MADDDIPRHQAPAIAMSRLNGGGESLARARRARLTRRPEPRQQPRGELGAPQKHSASIHWQVRAGPGSGRRGLGLWRARGQSRERGRLVDAS